MKITLICGRDGELFTTLPSKQIADDKDIGHTVRVGQITCVGGLYAVDFLFDDLKKYARKGFSSRGEAVSYEQAVLDEHLADIIGVLKAQMT